MRTATPADVAVLDELAAEVRRRKRETTQPIPHMRTDEIAALWWQELAGRNGSR
jgi:hypothetical protein